MQITQRDLTKNVDENLNPLIQILKKPENTRSIVEIMELIQYTKNINFFKEIIEEYNEKIHKEICQVISYEFYSEGQIIFKQGQLGDKFFIIIQGEVGVWIQPYTLSQEKLHKRRNILHSKARQSAFFTEVVTLSAGQSFGEQALIEGGKLKKRAATIACKTDCHLAVLNRTQFDQVLKVLKENKQGREMTYLLGIPLFEELDYKYVRKNIFLHFYPQQYERNQIIYKEGDSADKFYLIKKGETKMCKRINLLNTNNNAKASTNLQHYYSGSQGTYSKLQEIAILVEKQFFGFSEIMQNTSRQFTMICKSTEATILEMSASNFVQNILSSPQSPKCKQFLQLQILEQQRQHQKLLSQVMHHSSNLKSFLIKSEFDHNKQPKLHQSLTLNDQENQLSQIPQEFISVKNSNYLQVPAIPKSKIMREVLLNFAEIKIKNQNKGQENITRLKLRKCSNVFERSYNYAPPASYVTQFKVNYQKQSSLSNKQMKQFQQFQSSKEFEKNEKQFNVLKKQLDTNQFQKKSSQRVDKMTNQSVKDSSKQVSIIMSDAQTTQTEFSPKHQSNFNIYNKLYCQNMKNLKNLMQKKTLAKIFYIPNEKKLSTNINISNYSVLALKLQNEIKKKIL